MMNVTNPPFLLLNSSTQQFSSSMNRKKQLQTRMMKRSDKKSLNKKNDTIFLSLTIILLMILTFSLIFGVLYLSNYAHAHSLPVTETPAPNSIIKKGQALPSKIVIDFSERPDPKVSTMQVLNSKNERVDNGNFVVIGDHDREAMTTLDTHKITDGVYTVSWMTQSADDGHIARGSYVFGIGNVGPGSTSAAASIMNGKANQQQQQTQVQAVTSTLDGFIKWPLLVSQATIVGGIFSHLFLWEKFGSKIKISTIIGNINSNDKANLLWLRTFNIILVAASAVIIAAASLSLFLQITELSPNNSSSSYATIFKSLLPGSAGREWLIRSITSIVIIVASTGYYYLLKRRINRMIISSLFRGHQRQQQYKLGKQEEKHASNKMTSNQIKTPSSLLYLSLIAGAICIFANSMTSHNAGVKFLPSLAISIDWLHFMAVSIWIGGLFYISTILLTAIRTNTKMTTTIATTAATDTVPKTTIQTISNRRKRSTNLSTAYYLALLLPRFSLIATLSLGIIGVSGLYMAWIQLHSLNALFDTAYGNTLIIKLSAILPLVLLGGYHQIILHRNVVLAANIGNGRTVDGSRGEETSSDGANASISSTKITTSFNNMDNNNSNNSSKREEKTINIFSKFGKTIKIESLLAIGVLLAASLLTITSPPAMNMSSMSMMSSPSSMSSMPGMSSTAQIKNSTYVHQVKIMNVNTKIEINPFYSGFNTFKVSFTDAKGKPYTKVSSAEMIFTNNQADIGPITANLNQIHPGVYAITGAYVSQPGQWDISLSAQRTSDYDLNYQFTSKVGAPPSPHTSPVAQTGSSGTTTISPSVPTNAPNNNNMQEPMPAFDSFAWLAIGLAILVVFGSAYYYSRSKQELRKTIDMLETL